MRKRHWDRLGNGGLDFTELGFGTAPLGNLYRAISRGRGPGDARRRPGTRACATSTPRRSTGSASPRRGSTAFLRGKPRDELRAVDQGRPAAQGVARRTERTGIGKWFDVPARREVYDYCYDGVLRSVEDSLERLGVDRIDILFVPRPRRLHPRLARRRSDRRIGEFMAGGYRALRRLRDQGVITAFGAGVNEWQICQRMAERGDFDLFLLAGRYTLLEQEALESFLPLCAERGIGIVLGGPYNSGILATGPSRAPSTTTSRRRPRSSTASPGSRRCARATACR